jgi:nucleosome binding factor SPN SPT16 subunit
MAPKDEQEIAIITKAAALSSDIYAKYLREEITEIIDSDKKVKHSKLADGVEQAVNNKKYIKNVDPNQVDLCYTAIIQSGGRYNLKFSAVRYQTFDCLDYLFRFVDAFIQLFMLAIRIICISEP